MDVVALLDKLEETIAGGARIPLTNKIVLDEDGLYAVLDDIRASVPDELKQAKLIARDRDRILEEARREADSIMSEARQRAQRLAEESVVVEEAKRQSNEIIEKARLVAVEITDGAKRYANEVLETLLTNLERVQATVKEGQNEVKSSIAKDPLQRTRPL